MRLKGTPSDPLLTPAGLSLLIQTSLLPLPSSPSPPLGCIQDPPLPPPPCLHTHESLPSPSPGVPSSSPPLHCLPRLDPSLDASAGSSQPRFLGQITLQSFLGRASRTRTSRAPRRAQHSHTWGLSAACPTRLPAPRAAPGTLPVIRLPPKPVCRGRPSLLRRFWVMASGRAALPVTQPPAGARALFPVFCSVLDPTFCHCGFADPHGWSVP